MLIYLLFLSLLCFLTGLIIHLFVVKKLRPQAYAKMKNHARCLMAIIEKNGLHFVDPADLIAQLIEQRLWHNFTDPYNTDYDINVISVTNQGESIFTGLYEKTLRNQLGLCINSGAKPGTRAACFFVYDHKGHIFEQMAWFDIPEAA